ncbi:thrombopoietin isoform X1 [Sardina pilchardus]|uniref:thrombopoietin isoform X1 n=1 Tax=Sardina pilchardus TaxID=27697 RepID=UPI002E161521
MLFCLEGRSFGTSRITLGKCEFELNSYYSCNQNDSQEARYFAERIYTIHACLNRFNGTQSLASCSEGGMAVSRVLLLLLFWVASTVCDSHIKPSEFLCNEVERQRLNQAENLCKVMVINNGQGTQLHKQRKKKHRYMDKAEYTSREDNCSDLTQPLSSQIRLPDTKIHKKTWEKIHFKDRMAEVLQSLRNLVQDVEAARERMQSGCGSSLLERLEHNARNYQGILTHPSVADEVERLHPGEMSRPPIIQKSSSDLKQILRYFDNLLKGKLEWLMTELDVGCH